MSATTVGVVQVIATIDTSMYRKGAKDIDGANRDIENSTGRASKSQGALAGALSKVATVAKVATIASAAALTAVTVKAAKASWDQVDSVQQAVATLGRFYKSADDVTKVQRELIKYAQSDMGVLFNRKDLFAAAGNLAMYGVEAKNVSSNVKVMSRLAASGAVSWDELNAVIGRVISSGKLGRTEWEMLNKAGAGLSNSLANTDVTAKSLFKTLDNNVAKDISQDMNNIVPVGIRLQTAMRGLGNAILGVNELQDGFLPGSLGDRIVKTMQWLTEFGNKVAPTVRSSVEKMMKTFDGWGGKLSEVAPKILDTAKTIYNELKPGVIEVAREVKNFIPVLSRFGREVAGPVAQAVGVVLVGGLKSVLPVISSVISLFTKTVDFLITIRGVIYTAIGGFAAYRAAMVAIGVVQGAYNALLYITGTRLIIMNGSIMTVKNSVTLATAAQKLWNIALASNPIGLVIGVVGALAGALFALTGNTSRQQTATQRLSSAKQKAKEASDRLKESEDALARAALDVEGANLAAEGAQLRYNEAVAQYGPKSLEARQAEYDLRTARLYQKDTVNLLGDAEKNRKDDLANSKAQDEAVVAEQGLQRAVQNTTRDIENQWNRIGDLDISLRNLNGKNFSYSVNQTGNAPVDKSVAGWSVKKPFAMGGFTGRGGVFEPAGIVHKGEYVVPQRYVNQATGLPDFSKMSGGSTGITNHIGTIQVSKEVDADRLIQRLTTMQNVTSKGMAV